MKLQLVVDGDQELTVSRGLGGRTARPSVHTSLPHSHTLLYPGQFCVTPQASWKAEIVHRHANDEGHNTAR